MKPYTEWCPLVTDSLMCLRSDKFLSSCSSGTAAMKRTWRRTVRMRRVSWRNRSRGCRRKWSRPRANRRTFSLLYSRWVWQCRSILSWCKKLFCWCIIYRGFLTTLKDVFLLMSQLLLHLVPICQERINITFFSCLFLCLCLLSFIMIFEDSAWS